METLHRMIATSNQNDSVRTRISIGYLYRELYLVSKLVSYVIFGIILTYRHSYPYEPLVVFGCSVVDIGCTASWGMDQIDDKVGMKLEAIATVTSVYQLVSFLTVLIEDQYARDESITGSISCMIAFFSIVAAVYYRSTTLAANYITE